MSVPSILYALFIGPLEHFFEILFSVSNYILDDPGLSIVVLSLVMNILALPLYRRADAMQQEEREREAALRPWADHIRSHFKGAERFMILRTYYRQNGYKPTDALKGSISLFLQIPFFLAAYHFLSHLQQLTFVSFGPLMDLRAPDRMLAFSDLSVNVLPFLMTFINLLSCWIYLKGMGLKQKLQAYGMALVFLVLLYDSPSGLVFYWTLNNLFSLGKNIWYRLKPNRFVMPVLVSLLGFLACGTIFLIGAPTTKVRIFALLLVLATQLPLVYQLRKAAFSGRIALPVRDDRIFGFGCLFLILLTGLFIPVNVIQSSPTEFINPVLLNNPLEYVLFTTVTAIGAFGVWFRIFYKLTADKFKGLAAHLVWIVSGIAFCDYMLVGRDYGLISSALTFEKPLFSLHAQLANLLVVALVLLLLLAVARYRRSFIVPVYAILSTAIAVLSAYHAVTILRVSAPALARLEEAKGKSLPEIPLSRSGRNVIVLMLDRAINAYIPYLFEERPELLRQFQGFTYYPNTLSFGIATNIGSPPLFGGYEYVPEEMNARSSEKLVDKHNEALKIMPALFHGNGFLVSVCNPPYAGYQSPPDLTVFDEFPGIRKYVFYGNMKTMPEPIARKSDALLKNKFFRYGLFRIAPVCLQRRLYDDGTYNCHAAFGVQIANFKSQGLYKADGTPSNFLNHYLFLQKLVEMTRTTEDPHQDTFMMIDNDTTHAPTLLQLPDYLPREHVDNSAYFHRYKDGLTLNGRTLQMDNFLKVTHYHANMAAMIRLGEWFDYLRSQDLFDNTRIILVADHGYFSHQLDDMRFGKKELEDAMALNPLLMVKDFNADRFTTDRTFMTNGDVPTLALKGIIRNPVNPYTGKAISDAAKTERPQRPLVGSSCNVQKNNGNAFQGGTWYEIKDNVFDMSQWKEIPRPGK